MNKYYIENIFKRIKFDNLYVGVISYYSGSLKGPHKDSDKIEYIGIVVKCGDGYYQVDTGLLVLEKDSYKFNDTFPRITNPIKLSDFYRACYGKRKSPFPLSHTILPTTLNKVIKDIKKKVLVI